MINSGNKNNMPWNNQYIQVRFCRRYKIPNTLTSITSSEDYSLSSAKFIELTDDFDLDNCNFSGSEFSTTWFTHLSGQLKDNSSGTAKTMILGAANIALIPTDIATAISNKNWTLN